MRFIKEFRYKAAAAVVLGVTAISAPAGVLLGGASPALASVKGTVDVKSLPTPPAHLVSGAVATTKTPPPKPQPKPQPQHVTSLAHQLVPPKYPAASTTIYDSASPNGLPGGTKVAAGYSDGSYPTVGAFQQNYHAPVITITTNGNLNAQVIDVEPGDATPAQAASWVAARHAEHKSATVYESASNVSTVLAALNGQRAYLWVADATGSPHNFPGAAATQYQQGPVYDASSVSSQAWLNTVVNGG